MDRGYSTLNASVVRMLSNALKNDPAADLEDVLRKAYTTYPTMRRRVGEQRKRRLGLSSDKENSEATNRRVAKPPSFAPCPTPLPVDDILPFAVVSPLSPRILVLLGVSSDQPPSSSHISGSILRLVASGKPVSSSARAVLTQVGDDVVVKAGKYVDHDEVALLQYLRAHVPAVAAPEALGFVTIGSTSYMFMSRLDGDTVEHCWAELSVEKKRSVQRSLNQMLLALRRVEYTPGDSLGSLGRRVCKDTRMSIRTSPNSISSEAEFNDFLLDWPMSRASSQYRTWLRSLLKDDHRIVLTHGDLHPGNIMVVNDIQGGIVVSGIVDWEMGGFYPEYWESLKALNTRAITDTSDWWDHLPDIILGYGCEIAVDRLIERASLW